MSTGSEVTKALEYAIRKATEEFKDVADGQEMIDKITTKFEHTCNNPPTKEFEFILHKPFTDDEVCVALFNPREEQIEYFPTLLVGVQSLPANHPAAKLGPLLISLLFLVHRRNWAFMKSFISYNGLASLVDLIDDANLYLRGQVLETILCATDCDIYDWFKVPDSYEDKVLHNNLMAFARSPTTMNKLFANRTGSYPGGSFRALQIIAFSLSWIRALYTADQKLQLSQGAVAQLKMWAAGSSTTTTVGEEGTAPQEDPEVQLAKALLEDFLSPNNLVAQDEGALQAEGEYLASSINTTELEAAVREAAPLPPLPPPPQPTAPAAAAGEGALPPPPPAVQQQTVELTAQEMKERGNAEFKTGHYASARHWYNQALERLGASGSSSGSADRELLSALHANKATAAWKIAQECLTRQSEVELVYHRAQSIPAATSGEDATAEFTAALQDCVEDCRAALAVLPANCKAAYRLASVLLLQQQPQSALDVVLHCMQAVQKCGSSTAGMEVDAADSPGTTGSAGGDLEVLLQMRRKCAAAVMLAQSDAAKAAGSTAVGTLDAAQLGLSAKSCEILRHLLVQYQIELDLPLAAPASAAAAHATGGAVSRTELPAGPVSTLEASADETTANLKPRKKKSTTAIAAGANASYSIAMSDSSVTTAPVGDGAKPKKKKSSTASATTAAVGAGTKTVAQRLQQIDDDKLEELMKRGSIKA